MSPKGSAVLTLNSRLSILLMGSICLAANTRLPVGSPTSAERVRQVILRSRSLGAHGFGYSSNSLKTLSRRLTPADVPTLIDLAADKDLHVGVQFALASQCEATLSPVRAAVIQHKMSFLDAEEVLRLMEDSDVCRPETQQASSAMRSEIHSQGEAEQRRLEEDAKEKAAENARIQRNALKMLDPEMAKSLSRQEREEVYKRSLKEMGLKDGPMTPGQREMVERMYRTMVLGESGKRPPN
jgi:hypothetical protein